MRLYHLINEDPPGYDYLGYNIFLRDSSRESAVKDPRSCSTAINAGSIIVYFSSLETIPRRVNDNGHWFSFSFVFSFACRNILCAWITAARYYLHCHYFVSVMRVMNEYIFDLCIYHTRNLFLAFAFLFMYWLVMMDYSILRIIDHGFFSFDSDVS